MVPREVLVHGEWRPVIRYACAHGYAHRDRFNLHGEQLKDERHMRDAGALTCADDDLDDHWASYREHFLRGGFP